MGWYLKKSLALGPLRFNLSRKGIGTSFGVKGLRFSTGPRGKQINSGGGGIYYRASLESSSDASLPLPEQAAVLNQEPSPEQPAKTIGRKVGEAVLFAAIGGILNAILKGLFGRRR